MRPARCSWFGSPLSARSAAVVPVADPPVTGTGFNLYDAFAVRAAAPARLWAALILALAVLALEIAGGLFSSSPALLRDATHVGVDVLALLIGLGAARLATRAPDPDHASAYHRSRPSAGRPTCRSPTSP